METLSAYADGECGFVEALRVRLHLLGCAKCRQWLRQVREDERRFKDAYLHSARGADITAGVMQEVRKMAQEQAVRGKALRTRLIEAFVGVAMLAIVGAIIFPVFARGRAKARVTACVSNMKQLALGIQMFAEDYDGRLPGAVTWEEDIMPYVKNEQLFECLSRPRREKGGYAINPLVAGSKLEDIADPATTVLLYEVDEHGQPVYPHNDGANFAFVDGHTRWFSKDNPPEGIETSGFIPPTRNYGLAKKLKLAYEATIEVWVENVYRALLQAEAAVHKCGGFLLSSQLKARHDRAHASMIVKVPTAEVGNCINALGALGFVAHRQITGEDLTERHVSATREVGSKQTRAQRLGEMVETMKSDKQRVAAEQNLGQVEGETQSLSDTLYHIDTRVTLATISATLLQETAPKPPASILGSFASAGHALARVGRDFGRVAAWVIVFAPVWGTAAIVAYALRRKLRK